MLTFYLDIPPQQQKDLRGDINGHSRPGVIILTFSYTLRFTVRQGVEEEAGRWVGG